MKTIKPLFTLALVAVLMTSCNPKKNSSLASGSAVTIQSSAYTNNGTVVMSPTMRFLQNNFFIPSATAAAVTDFQFCITQMKVVSSVGGAPGAAQSAILGLVNVSDPNANTVWGKIDLPDGSTISEIHFEVHHDAENCSGAAYSASYNGKTLTADMEF